MKCDATLCMEFWLFPSFREQNFIKFLLSRKKNLFHFCFSREILIEFGLDEENQENYRRSEYSIFPRFHVRKANFKKSTIPPLV